jgi:hypothetical protein
MMPEMHDDAVDALMDLSHDLGKYLRLPLAMLPPDAGPAAVRGAVETALRRTRVGPSGIRAAREIWEGLREEIAGPLAGNPGFQELEEAVERALAWEAALDGGREDLDRAAVAADFEAVAERIRDLIGEITRG